MSSVTPHIISTLLWNTSFDAKDRCAELQDRLSSWCKQKAQMIFRDVLDKLCPPDQVWTIDALELDLGEIDYNNLEAELSLRIRKQLEEQLSALLLETDKSGIQPIGIHSLEIAQLEMLERFLREGIMPWNHAEANRLTAEQILDILLRENQNELVEMLWRAGEDEQVRKRIVWQFSHPTVLKVIRGLEPDHHEEIASFSDELSRAQQEENIVRGNSETLRKDILLWVLNYLFDERGTLFNRIAFMKSTLRQMADHHNVSFDELFLQVQRAVNMISARRKVSSGFIQTITSISNERLITERKIQADTTDHWYTLEILFRERNIRKSQLPRFNELISLLSRSDTARFATLISMFGTQESFWENVIEDFNENTYETILFAVSPPHAHKIKESIEFLQDISTRSNTHVFVGVRLAAMKFAIENGPAAFSYDRFLLRVSSVKKLAIRDMVALWSNTETAFKNSVAAVEISKAIRNELISRSAATANKELFDKHFTVLLRVYRMEQSRRRMNGQKKQQLIRSISGMIQANAQAAFRQLRSTLPRQLHRDFLREVTDLPTAHSALSKLKPEWVTIISAIESALHHESRTKLTLRGISMTASHAALEMILIRPDITTEQLMQLWMEQSTDAVTRNAITAVSARYQIKIHINADDHSASAPGSVELALLNETLSELITSPGSHLTMEELLSDVIRHSRFSSWIEKNKSTSFAVLEYLLPGGVQLMKTVIPAFQRSLKLHLASLTDSQIAVQLNETFWSCVVTYSEHKGNRTRLLEIFRTAIVARFPLIAIAKHPLSRVDHAPAEHVLKSGEVIRVRQLFLLIEHCLADAKEEIEYEGKRYRLKELIQHVTQLRPVELRRIISGLTATPARIQLLKNTIAFPEFSAWIVSDLRSETSRLIDTMLWFCDVASSASSQGNPDKLLRTYWEELWKLVRIGSCSKEDRKQLIRTSFTALAYDLSIDLDLVITLMRERRISMSPAVRAELMEAFPVLVALPDDKVHAKHAEQLMLYHDRGLLEKFTWHLLTQQRAPVWSGSLTETDPGELLNEILLQHPAKFFLLLRRENISEAQAQWLSRTVGFGTLVTAIGQQRRDKQRVAEMSGNLAAVLGRAKISGTAQGVLKEIVFRKLLSAATADNWKSISTENLWSELLWEMYVKHNVSQQEFIAAIDKLRTQLPPAFQVSFTRLKARMQEKPAAPKKKKAATVTLMKSPELAQGVAVRNAGIVLLSTYVQTLFARLALVNEGKFVSSAAQAESVHYLQYVVTGLTRTEESLLPLNKVMCGLPLAHPVPDGITISEAHSKLIDGLIKAAIGYWSAIEGSSIEAFRGNWLVRNGTLTEYADKWDLRIEKRPYDVMIRSSPFAFSIIRYPWMEKPLHVTWPY